MDGWANFFVAEVGASAALTGLIFVGVSINLQRIIAFPRLINRALLALVVLGTILVVASLMLTPGQPLWLAGAETLGVGVISWVWVLSLDIRAFIATDRKYRRAYLSNVALSQLATLPYIAAGAIMLRYGSIGLYVLVPAVLLAFIKAITDAWVLLIEINR